MTTRVICVNPIVPVGNVALMAVAAHAEVVLVEKNVMQLVNVLQKLIRVPLVFRPVVVCQVAALDVAVCVKMSVADVFKHFNMIACISFT